jgi:hypothetical protein
VFERAMFRIRKSLFRIGLTLYRSELSVGEIRLAMKQNEPVGFQSGLAMSQI